MDKITLSKEQKSSQYKGVSGKKMKAMWGQMEEKNYLKSGNEKKNHLPLLRGVGTINQEFYSQQNYSSKMKMGKNQKIPR